MPLAPRMAQREYAPSVALPFVLALAFVVASLGPGRLSAQSGDTLPLIRYTQGGLVTRYLPYGTAFRIRGSTNLPAGSADVVQVITYEIVKKGKATTRSVVDSSCWVRPLSPAPTITDTLFEVMAPSLKLQRKYLLDFLFYRRIGLNDVDQLLRRTVDGMVDALIKKGVKEFTADDVNPVWKTVVDQAYRDMGLGQVDLGKVGQCPAAQQDSVRALGQPSIHLTVAEANAVGDAVQAVRVVRGRLVLLQQAEAGLRDRSGATIRLAPLLYQAVRDPKKRSMPDSAAIARVIATINDVTLADPNDQELTKALSDLRSAAERNAFGLKEAADRQDLADLIDASARVMQRRSAYTQAQADAQVQRDSVSRLHPKVDPGYWVGGAAQIGGQAWGDTTRVNALRLSIAYVTAAAYLGGGAIHQVGDGALNAKADLDAASFLILKYHAGPVDKSAPNPYSSRWARLSFTIGIKALSDLRFRGQKQAALFSGITPTVGASYDISRYFDAHAGLVFFRQPSVNPFNVNDQLSKARTAFYFGLGFDVDPINRLNKLLTKG